MRLSRPRLRLRTLLIAVAVVGLGLCGWTTWERWGVFRDRAYYHAYMESVFRDALALSEDEVYFKHHPEIEGIAPERPPLSPYDPRAFTEPGRTIMEVYHRKMRRHWETRW